MAENMAEELEKAQKQAKKYKKELKALEDAVAQEKFVTQVRRSRRRAGSPCTRHAA